jgi:hypothetical protein
VTGRQCRGRRGRGKSDASLSSFPGADEPDTALAARHAETAPGGCVGSGGRPPGGSRGGPVGHTPRSSSDRLDHSAGRGRTPGDNRLEHKSRTGMNPRAPALGARGWTITRGCAKKGLELLNRVPVIRPEGPGCPRLRALTPRPPSAGTIYRSVIKLATADYPLPAGLESCVFRCWSTSPGSATRTPSGARAARWRGGSRAPRSSRTAPRGPGRSAPPRDTAPAGLPG